MTQRESIPREHEKLEILADRLRAIAACPRELMPRWRWRRLLVGDVAVFASALRDHFEYEETAGFFDDLRQASPRLATKVDGLRAEHDTMRAMLERVVTAVDEMRDADAVRASLDELLDLLAHHEREESRAAQDAFLTDQGGPG